MTDRLAITRAVEAHPFDVATAQWRRWRLGTKDPTVICAQVGPEPSGMDVTIGAMETAMLAAEVVMAHNAALREVQG